MIAFYDLAICPISFDFAHFLTAASRAANGEPLHVVIVPGPNAGFKAGDHKPLAHAEKVWRLNHILIPLCAAIGAGVTVARDREFARAMTKGDVFPYGYGVDAPKRDYFISAAIRAMSAGFAPRFSPSDRATEHVARWLGERKNLVTITLRKTHSALRNSNTLAWSSATKTIRNAGFYPVIIPDTAKMTERLDMTHPLDWASDPLVDEFPLAACDLDIRLALYDAAVMNMASSGGPFMLNIFDTRRPYLFFLNVFENAWYADQTGRAHWHPSAEYMALMGLPVGEQFPFSGPQRRTVWEQDDYATIMREFDAAMVPAMEMA